MAENITLNNIATFVNDTTAVNTYNSNNTAIVNAFSDVMSRSGVSPNQMTSTLDMNNQQIINLPFPTTASSPARLIDISGGQITVVTATTGASGHVVPFLDGTNTWSGPQTLQLNSLGTGTGLSLIETVSGTNTGGINVNVVAIADTLNVGSNNSTGLYLNQVFGGSSAFGGRVGIFGNLTLTSPTNASNTNRNYVGVDGTSTASSADGGTNPNAAGTSAGAFFGGNFVGVATSGATALLNVTGMEVNTQMQTGSSCWAKSIAQFSGEPSDAVAGSAINTMLWLYNQSGAVKWNNAILIDTGGGLGQFPIAATGTLFLTGPGTVTSGIDLSSTTFSSAAYKSLGFFVGPTGGIQTGLAGIANGILGFNGITSGTVNLFINNTATLLTSSQPFAIGLAGTVGGSLTLNGLTSGSTVLSVSSTAGSLLLGGGNVTIDSGGNTITNGAIRVGATSGFTAGGDLTHAYLFTNTGVTFGIFCGSGAPTITAQQGSLYIRSDGATNVTRAYINTTGSNVWTAINTVA